MGIFSYGILLAGSYWGDGTVSYAIGLETSSWGCYSATTGGGSELLSSKTNCIGKVLAGLGLGLGAFLRVGGGGGARFIF